MEEKLESDFSVPAITYDNVEDNAVLEPNFDYVHDSPEVQKEKADSENHSLPEMSDGLSSISSVESVPDLWDLDSDIEYQIELDNEPEEPLENTEWDNLTKEESEERINILLIVLSILFFNPSNCFAQSST